MLSSNFILGFLFALNVSSAFATSRDLIRSPLPYDPLYADQVLRAGDRRYGVDLRLILHGVKLEPELKDRLLRSLARTYSQCDGVFFEPRIVSEVNSESTNLQDHLVEAKDMRLSVTSNWIKFFSPWIDTRSPLVIDVHVVDFLSNQNRKAIKEGTPLGQTELGVSFDSRRVDNIYLDPRKRSDRDVALSAVVGNSVVIALETLKSAEARKTFVRDPKSTAPWSSRPIVQGYANRNSSLLAHELGHILLETQLNTNHFVDHYCPASGAHCESGYLMSGGGAWDYVQLQAPDFKTPIAYSPLPSIDPLQCEALKTHPIVKRRD